MDQEIEILFIEDNQSDAELTIRALKKNNMAHKLVHLIDGAQALDFLFCRGEYSSRNKENKPKLILLDLKMPKVSGLEVLQQIKADDSTRKIPVVVLTSSKEDPDIAECYHLGVNSYVVKPVKFEEFFKAISKLGIYWLNLNETHNQ